MKSRYSFFICFLVFIINLSFAQEATVNTWSLVITTAPGGGNALFYLLPGMVVNIESAQDYYYKVSYKNIKGWIKKSGLVLWDNNFSNTKGRSQLSKKIFQENGKNYLYYYKNEKFIKYNITDRAIDSTQKLPKDLDSITPTPRNDLFLLQGTTATNGNPVHHYMIFNFSSGKVTYLFGLQEYFMGIESFQFSENGDYLSVLFYTDRGYLCCLYRTSDGEMADYATRVRGAYWVGNTLVLNSTEYLWTINPGNSYPNMNIGFTKDKMLMPLKSYWLISERIEAKVLDQLLYINTYNGVITLDIKTKEIKQTPYLGLNLSQDKNLNFFTRKEAAYLKNTTNNHYFPDFQGTEPKIEFIGFSRNNIIGRTKYEKIETIFLYDEDGKELYRYKAIDEPMAVSEDGILADINSEKDLNVITIEDPNKQEFFFVFDKEHE